MLKKSWKIVSSLLTRRTNVSVVASILVKTLISSIRNGYATYAPLDTVAVTFTLLHSDDIY